MVNREALMRKREELNAGNSTKADFWKPKVGDNKIRLVPYKDKATGNFFFEELMVHFKLGKTRTCIVNCPAQFGNYCPICARLEEMKEGATKEVLDFINETRVKKVCYVPVFDYNDPNKRNTIQIWSASTGCIDWLIKQWLDPEWGEINDANTGHVVTVTKEAPSGKFNMGKYTCSLSPKADVLPPELVEAATNLDLDYLFRQRSTEALECLFGGGTYDEADAIDAAAVSAEAPVDGDTPADETPGDAQEPAQDQGSVEFDPNATEAPVEVIEEPAAMEDNLPGEPEVPVVPAPVTKPVVRTPIVAPRASILKTGIVQRNAPPMAPRPTASAPLAVQQHPAVPARPVVQKTSPQVSSIINGMMKKPVQK